jgi:hypothetical protein
MTCIYCGDDPEVSENCYCRTIDIVVLEQPETCAVTIGDVDALQLQAAALTARGQFLAHELVNLWGDLFEMLGSSAICTTIELHDMIDVIRDRPEHGGKRKNHPQPVNPKSFRRKTNR